MDNKFVVYVQSNVHTPYSYKHRQTDSVNRELESQGLVGLDILVGGVQIPENFVRQFTRDIRQHLPEIPKQRFDSDA